MNIIRRIIDLENAEAAYAPTHAAWVASEQMYLNGSHPIQSTASDSFGLRLVKDRHGRLKVDLSACRGERFPSFPSFASFAGQLTPLHVDEALPDPRHDPSRRRIVDMVPGQSVFISPYEVWVFEERRMWLNGYSIFGHERSTFRPILLHKTLDGAYTVDLSHCPDFDYASEPNETEEHFPLQVQSRVN